MVATVDGWVPLPHRETVRGLAREIDAAIAGFVRGQSGVCLILGSFYAVALTLDRPEFRPADRAVSGLISFIPYVGSLTGFLVAAGVAVAQFWPDWTSILVVVGVFIVGQFIEGNVSAPKLVGESVGLHPVWLMFALFAFGYLFGFVGLLLAVPLAAAIGVLVRFALRQYLASPLYTGRHDRAALSDGEPGARARVPQLALALDHAESLAREDFLAGPVERRGAGADRALARLADRTVLLSGRKAPARAISRRSGRGARRAASSPPRARRRRSAGRARDRRAGGRGSRRAADSTSARCFICSISRARRAPSCCSPRAAAGRLASWCRDLASRLRALPVVALARPTTRCCAR